jgi:hypothetical protein
MLHPRGWLGSTPEGRRPQIRGFRAGGSLAVASSTPATQLLSPAKMLKLNHAAKPADSLPLPGLPLRQTAVEVLGHRHPNGAARLNRAQLPSRYFVYPPN